MGSLLMESELVTRFIDHLYNSLLHFKNDHRTLTSVLILLETPIVVFWQRILTQEV
jgi:hypothetical protein